MGTKKQEREKKVVKKLKKTKQGMNKSVEKRLLERVMKLPILKGKQIPIDRSPKEKMSKIILDFASPLLELCDDPQLYPKIIMVAIAVWNFCLLPPEGQKVLKNDLIKAFSPDEESLFMTKLVIELLIDRKKQYFSENKKFILDYEILERGNELSLQVASISP